VGDRLQDHTWSEVVEKVIALSGGSAAEGVEHHSESLSEDEAAAIGTWLQDLTMQRKRNENEERIAEPV
jgi:hypothetical protein